MHSNLLQMETSRVLVNSDFGEGIYSHRKWPSRCHGDRSPDFSRWRLRVFGAVAQERRLSWGELQSLGRAEISAPLVAPWPLGGQSNDWSGIRSQWLPVGRLSRRVDRVLVHSEGGYSTELLLSDFLADGVLLADSLGGEPLNVSLGGPLRLVVPHLQAWKCSKWVRGLEFLEGEDAQWH